MSDPGAGWAKVSGVAGVIAAIAVVAIIFVGGYGLYWWLAKDTTEKRYDVNTGTQQYQSALISQQRDRVQAIDIATHEGQKKQLTLTFCSTQTEVTVVPPDLAAAAARLC